MHYPGAGHVPVVVLPFDDRRDREVEILESGGHPAGDHVGDLAHGVADFRRPLRDGLSEHGSEDTESQGLRDLHRDDEPDILAAGVDDGGDPAGMGRERIGVRIILERERNLGGEDLLKDLGDHIRKDTTSEVHQYRAHSPFPFEILQSRRDLRGVDQDEGFLVDVQGHADGAHVRRSASIDPHEHGSHGACLSGRHMRHQGLGFHR